jgi:hypothetical protein
VKTLRLPAVSSANSTTALADNEANFFPIQEDSPPLCAYNLYTTCQLATCHNYSDPTGRSILCKSTTGNSDFLVVYNYNNYAIITEQMKNKTEKKQSWLPINASTSFYAPEASVPNWGEFPVTS